MELNHEFVAIYDCSYKLQPNTCKYEEVHDSCMIFYDTMRKIYKVLNHTYIDFTPIAMIPCFDLKSAKRYFTFTNTTS